MALTIGDNFKYQANKPNFERDSFATLEAMKAYPETSIDDGHLSYCAETNKHYKFLSSNTVDETTGKWREFETGSSISEDGVTGQVLTKTDDGYEWQDPQGSQEPQEPQETRIVLDEFSERKFFGEFSKVTGAPAIGWAGALFIDDFSSSEYRDFYCCMTYGQGIVIRHTYATDTYEYLNSFIADSSTTSSSYNLTNKMNSGGWGNYYNGSELPLVYISRCSSDSSYIHTYYAYKINRSVTPFKFEKVLTIKYTGSKLAAITSDITIDAEKKHLYVHGYKSGSANAITGTSIVMVFNLPEPGSSSIITLTDSDILWEFEFFVNEAAQDLCVSGGRLYYPYGSKSVHGIAVVDTKTGEILQNLNLANISTEFIVNPEPEGVALSNGNVYLNYHHADTNSNEVCLVEFALQGVKESLKVPTSQSEGSVDIPNATQSTAGLMSAEDKTKLDSIDVDNINNTLNDTRALKGATMRFNGFVNGVNITQTEVNEWDGIVYDTSINKFLAKKGTLTPTYHNVWSGMDVYMSDELGTSILKDKLYLYGEDIYKWSDSEGTLVKITSEGSITPDVPLATQNTDGLMSSEDKTKLDNIDVDGITDAINDKRALNGTTVRFSSFVNGVTVEQVGTVEFDSIVFDTAINRFLAKKNNSMLSPTYYNIWQGMNAYMSDESGTSILKDKLYICDDVVYSWSDAKNTLVKVDKEISNATQSKAGLMSAEDKAKLDGVGNNANNYTHPAGSAASKSLGLYKISTDSTSHVQSVSAVTKSDITGLGIPAQDTTYNNATSTASGLMSASDKEKLDSINVDNEAINVVADARALKGATMRFNGFVSGVTIAQVGASEWDSIVYDTSINKFLAKKGTLSPTYYNIWSGMDSYMSDEVGTSILKDKLYIYDEDVYIWSNTEGTLVKVDKEISNATQSTAGLMSSEDKTKLDNAFSRKVLQKAELADLSSTSNWFASSINTDGNLQIEKKCGLAYTAICKVDTTALETGKAYRAVVIYKSPDSSFILSNGEYFSQMQTECPKSEDWNQIEFEFLNFYGYIAFQGLANVFPQYSIVTFKSIEFYPYGRVSADLLDLADEVNAIKNDISAEDWQDITPLCAVRRYENVTVGSELPSATNGGGYLCAELDVKEGERYKLTTYSSRDKYPLIFVDKDNIVIKYVASYQSSSAITEYDGTGFEFSIPKNCVKIITHYNAGHTGVTFKLMKASRFYVESINNKYKDANKYLWERLYPFSEKNYYKGVLCGEIGTFIKESNSKTNCTDIISCSEGDVFHIRTYYNNISIYMFFDENNRCIGGEGNIKVLPTLPKLFDDYVVAPKNATKLVVNGRLMTTNQNGDEDSITDIFVIKCVKKNEPIILRNTDAISAITSATKKFVKNNSLIKQWDGYFCIAHISDVHADPVRYKRFRTFVDNVYSINTAICTGDLVSFHNNDAKKMQIEHERMFAIGGEKDIMIVVGNHEKTGSGDTLYTEQQIKDYSGLENLYYYKDWTNNTRDLAYKVRVIVLNQYDYDGTDIGIANRTHYSQAQINWFIDTLKEASNDGRAVMVAMHTTDKFVQPTNNDYGFNCNFPSDLDTNQSGYIIEDIIDAFKNGTHLTESYTWTDNSQTIDVDADFSGKKGSFIAYMCGHNHRDQVGYSPQHPNQLYLCIAAGCLQQMYAIYGQGNYGEQVSDLSRVIGTKSEDCFNVYGIDFDNKTVRIVRVGADVTCNMKSRKYLELPWSPS